MRGVFVVSLLFFLCAVGFAMYFFNGGTNQVSCDNVNINISGPMSIASGKKLSLDVHVENKNPVPMRNAELDIIFPEGARDAEYSSVSLPSTELQIGTVEVDERVRSSVQALLFGQEMTQQELTAELSYEIDDSNASFTCSESYEVTIATAPIQVTVEGFEEVYSGQEVDLKVMITSNSEEIVSDLRMIVNYPFGFNLVSSEPEPSYENTVWDLGDLAPGAEKTLVLHGVVSGQGIESSMIQFEVGEKDTARSDGIVTVLQKVDHSLFVTRPFLSLELSIDEATEPEVVADLGSVVSAQICWKNTTNDALHDVEIDAILDGVMLDEASVTSNSGYYRSFDNTIIWTPQTTHDNFRVVEPGEEGVLNFIFSTEQFKNITSVVNPVLSIELAAQARRVSESISVPQSLIEQSKRVIRFNTDPTLEAYAVYSNGPFNNTGSHPPRVDQETTYTVVLSISNTVNEMHATEVHGVLPEHVRWLGAYSPTDSSISYNSVTREVIWSPGVIARTTGYESPLKVVYFQIATIPSISQRDYFLTLVDNLTLQGVDSFTGSVLEREVRLVDSQ